MITLFTSSGFGFLLVFALLFVLYILGMSVYPLFLCFKYLPSFFENCTNIIPPGDKVTQGLNFPRMSSKNMADTRNCNAVSPLAPLT
jgi:hypothetical protein